MSYVLHYTYMLAPLPLEQGDTQMSGQSTLVSIRLDADTLQGLDMLIGANGLSNRSDVIRLAIQQLLNGQAKLPGMKSVRIPLGRQMELQLASLYELFGVTHEQRPQRACNFTSIRKSSNSTYKTNSMML